MEGTTAHAPCLAVRCASCCSCSPLSLLARRTCGTASGSMMLSLPMLADDGASPSKTEAAAERRRITCRPASFPFCHWEHLDASLNGMWPSEEVDFEIELYDPVVATTLGGLADVRIATGDHAAAAELHRRVLAIQGKALPPNHLSLAAPLVGLGRATFLQGHTDEAVAPLERALAIQEQHDAGLYEVSMTRFFLAQALWTSAGDSTASDCAGRACGRRAAGGPGGRGTEGGGRAVARVASRGLRRSPRASMDVDERIALPTRSREAPHNAPFGALLRAAPASALRRGVEPPTSRCGCSGHTLGSTRQSPTALRRPRGLLDLLHKWQLDLSSRRGPDLYAAGPLGQCLHAAVVGVQHLHGRLRVRSGGDQDVVRSALLRAAPSAARAGRDRDEAEAPLADVARRTRCHENLTRALRDPCVDGHYLDPAVPTAQRFSLRFAQSSHDLKP